MSRWIRDWTKDTGLLLASQIGITLMTSGISVILARSLDAKHFGVFSGFLGLSQALSLAIDVGLATWLLRELSRVWAQDSHALATTEAAGLLWDALLVMIPSGVALVTLTATAGALMGLPPDLVALVVGLMLYVVLIAMATALETGLRARRHLRLVVFTNAMEKLVLIIGVAVGLVLGFGLVGIAAAYPLAGIVRVLLDYVLALAGAPGRSEVPRRPPLAVLKASAPFALNSAAFSLVPRLDLPLVALFSVTSAGYFALGFQVFTTIVIVPVIAATTLYPYIARRSHAISLHRVALVFGLVGVFAASIAIAVTPVLLPAVFGSRYRHAVTVTQIMALALPLVFYANGLMVGAYAEEREHELLRRTLFGALAGSVAVVCGEAAFGVVGAAVGYGLRYGFFLVALLSLPRTRCTTNRS